MIRPPSPAPLAPSRPPYFKGWNVVLALTAWLPVVLGASLVAHVLGWLS